MALTACGGDTAPATDAAGPPQVATTLGPSRFLAERLIGDSAEVFCDLPAGEDALHWQPGAEELRRIQGADLAILMGAGADGWRERVSLADSRLVVVAEAFREQWIEVEESVTHTHGGGTEHSHAGSDPHAWMDPLLLLEGASAVRDAVARTLGPRGPRDLDQRMRSLEEDLRGLHAALESVEVPEGVWIYTSHRAFDYLGRRYGWPLVNLDLDPTEAVGEEVRQTLALQLEARPGSLLLWASEPTEEAAASASELGLQSVLFDVGEDAADGPTFLELQQSNVLRLQAALEATR